MSNKRKIIRLAILDDEESQLFVIEKQVESYNRHSENHIILSKFTKSADLIEHFNHDFALIDINLDGEEFDGFAVAKIIMKKFHKPVVMTSQMIDKTECLESLLPKVGFRVAELVSRFDTLKMNFYKNAAEICSRSHDYHVPTLAG